MQTVTVNFDVQGNPTIDVSGVVGPGCKKMTDELLRQLGAASIKCTPKPEYYQRTSTRQNLGR